MNAISPGWSLQSLASLPLWVVWRSELRNDRKTKVPYSPKGGMAKADDPGTWATRLEAEAAAARMVNGSGGLGLEFADIGGGLHLGGIDLDTCRDPATGIIEPWAQEVVDRFASYAEVSPSRTGAKVFFAYRLDDRDQLREAMGSQYGKLWQRGGTEHPPAIELHIGNRYFAVTGERLPNAPEAIETIPAETLLWLIREAGPAFKGVPQKAYGKPLQASPAADDILARLHRAAAFNPRLDGILNRMDGYGSRSEAAMALGSAVKAAGWSRDDMAAVLHRHPATAEWSAEKGEAAGQRELDRIWSRAAEPGDDAGEWGEPIRAILHRSSAPPPELPLAVFGPVWAGWITEAAQGANAPADYAALPLIALASALIGNARWAVAWRGWAEPPVLWCASVGNPSSGKSSGATPVNRDALADVERYMRRDHPKQMEEWETVASVAKAVLKQWEKDVAKAIKKKEPMPEKPAEAAIPPKPIKPRAKVMDVTVEKLAEILESLPKGVLYVRDELASWLLNLSRYSNGGTDRPFWLEAYVGGPMQVDRVKNPDPVFIGHLSSAIFGTIQPDRLEDILSGADDGLASRFLWAWPDSQRFAEPDGAADTLAASNRLLRLAELQMVKNEVGDSLPAYVHLAPEARAVLADFGGEMQARENGAPPLVKSSLGKARGQALRLSIVLEYLWWCASPSGTPEPANISLSAVQAATGLMDAYFLPMGARVLGDCAIPAEERNARTLAAWIMDRRPDRVNVSMIRDEARLHHLRETEPVKQACKFLADAGWLREAPLSGGRGRPRGDYLVNPKLWEAAP